MHQTYIYCLLTALLLVSNGVARPDHRRVGEAEAPPNIVFILADDLGWNDVGYHGSEIRTPNIDKLAETGVKLENYYVQQVCTPSRAALMSGRYPIHLGLQHEVIYAGQRSGLPLHVKTLANQLKERGYDTHGIGKWHLGFFEEDYLPTNRGFDSWTGYMTGNEGYYTHINCESLGCGYDFYENNTLDTSDNTTYSTLRYTQRAREIIMGHASPETADKGNATLKTDEKRHAASGTDDKEHVTPGTDDKRHVTPRTDEKRHVTPGPDEKRHVTPETDNKGPVAPPGTDDKGHATPRSKPLFLYLPFQAVHSPLQVPESYIKPYKHTSLSPDRQIFAGMMSCLDEAIGNITSYLKANNMWDNTILIFSTDNGGETNAGGNNWPLRGKKWTLWEGGLRGVSFIHSPLFESSTVGTVHKSLMHISDWYPTIVEGILNDTLPSTLSLDGVNMWDSLRTGRQGPRTELLHTIDPLDRHPGIAVYDNTFPTNTTAAIRVGDWKLLTGYPGIDKIFPPVNYPSLLFSSQVDNWHESVRRRILGSDSKYRQKAHLLHDDEYHDLQFRHMLGTLYKEELIESLKLTSDGKVKNVWLFNITDDPEELLDRSQEFPEIVKQLLDKLAEYNRTAAKPNFPATDPAGSPAHNGGAWRPWVSTTTIQSLLKDMNSALQTTSSYLKSMFTW